MEHIRWEKVHELWLEMITNAHLLWIKHVITSENKVGFKSKLISRRTKEKCLIDHKQTIEMRSYTYFRWYVQ